MQLSEYLFDNRLVLDGSMGTYFSKLMNQQGAISEYANLTNPNIIEKIHVDYMMAGAKIVRTNTFAANQSVLHINAQEQEELVRAACQISKRARTKFMEGRSQVNLQCPENIQRNNQENNQESNQENNHQINQQDNHQNNQDNNQKYNQHDNQQDNKQRKLHDNDQQQDKESHPQYSDDDMWILGNIGPIPVDAYTQDDLLFEEYKKLCDIFIEEDLDGIHFETFSSMKYINGLFSYIKSKKKDMFVLVSFSVNKNGFTSAGIGAKRLLERVSDIEEIDGVGFNCGVGSGHMYRVLKNVQFPENKVSYVAPNAGYPEQMQNRMIFMDNEDYFTRNMQLIANLGIQMISGCCGTSPEYIKKLSNEVKNKDLSESKEQYVNELFAEGRDDSEGKNAFYQLFDQGKKVIAVELDPPFDSNIDTIMECAHDLKELDIDIITLADSPMGRSRVDSILMSSKIAQVTGMKVMPHVCCRDRNMISMRSTLLGAYIHGVRNMLIVTGDPVPSDSRISTSGVFDYNSVQLMEFVKELNIEHFSEEPLYYGGALNFARGTVQSQVNRMKKKIEAGAKYFLSQPIYSKEDADLIRSIKEQVDTKILCGIMPLVSYRNACFIKNEITGIYVPDEIVARYKPEMTKEEGQKVGAEIAKEMMVLLDDIADGFYFMLPFNRVSLMEQILKK